MSWCDRCPKPGNCCKRLGLSRPNPVDGTTAPVTFWKDEGEAAVRKFLDDNGLPFEPLAVKDTHVDLESGRQYVTYDLSCPKLGDNGRCTIYENRPQLCQEYKPGHDQLCVFTKNGKLRAAHRE